MTWVLQELIVRHPSVDLEEVYMCIIICVAVRLEPIMLIKLVIILFFCS